MSFQLHCFTALVNCCRQTPLCGVDNWIFFYINDISSHICICHHQIDSTWNKSSTMLQRLWGNGMLPVPPTMLRWWWHIQKSSPQNISSISEIRNPQEVSSDFISPLYQFSLNPSSWYLLRMSPPVYQVLRHPNSFASPHNHLYLPQYLPMLIALCL